MIKVNLQHRKAAVGVAAGSATGTSGAGSLAGLIDRIRSRGAGDGFSAPDQRSTAILGIIYAVVLAGGWWMLDQQKSEMLARVDAEIQEIDSKLNLVTSELNKTNGYEQIKKSLESDEKTIRTKIETIQELIRDRSAPPKILTTLSETIPNEVWLQDFSLQNRRFRIMGNSGNMDVVSDFMKSLEETIYFKGVVLKSSRQDTIKGGRLSASFELEAERR